ncbi:MAG: outer membrane lipoprotein carrier protein LolA [Bacteroidales bacterium]
MNKKVFFLFFYLLSAFFLNAQNVDGGATNLLQELSSKYHNFTTIKIDYTYKSEKEKKVLGSEKGKMTLKGNKYYMTFGAQTFYCDGVTLWNHQKESNEVSIFAYEEEEDMLFNPAKLLENWEKEFRAKFIREEFENNKIVQIIDMMPLKSKSYYKIRLFIDKNKKEIIRASLYEKDNTIYTYFVDKFITNSPVEDSFFHFNTSQYPNITINDMR